MPTVRNDDAIPLVHDDSTSLNCPACSLGPTLSSRSLYEPAARIRRRGRPSTKISREGIEESELRRSGDLVFRACLCSIFSQLMTLPARIYSMFCAKAPQIDSKSRAGVLNRMRSGTCFSGTSQTMCRKSGNKGIYAVIATTGEYTTGLLRHLMAAATVHQIDYRHRAPSACAMRTEWRTTFSLHAPPLLLDAAFRLDGRKCAARGEIGG